MLKLSTPVVMCHTAQAVHDWVPRVPEETGICILFPRLPYLKHKLKCSSRVRPEEQQRWKHPAGTRYDTIDRMQTEMRCKQRIPACKRSSLNRLEGLFSIFCFDAFEQTTHHEGLCCFIASTETDPGWHGKSIHRRLAPVTQRSCNLFLDFGPEHLHTG